MDVIDVTERLMAEFEQRLPLHVVSRVIRDCRRDLTDSRGGPEPEVLERHARRRLLEAVGAQPLPQPRPPEDAP